MNLYEITKEIQAIENEMMAWAEEHDGDISEFPLGVELDGLEQDKTAKIISMGLWYKNIVAEAEAIEAEAKKLKKRQAAAENKAERIKEYIGMCLGEGNKLSDPKVVFNWRKSEAVNLLVEAEKLPDEYQRVKTTVDPDRVAIKAALKSGEVLEFAELLEKQNIQIK